MSTRIFVARLPTDVRDEDIRDIFGRVGEELVIMKNSMEVLKRSPSSLMQDPLSHLLTSKSQKWPKRL